MLIYKRHCNTCGNYYEGQGKLYCSRKCNNAPSWNKGLTKETDERVFKSAINMKGKVGCHPAWNKGLTKEIDIRIKKISEKMSGNNNPAKRAEIKIKLSKSHIGLQSGKKHPRYGIKLTQEHKDILKKANTGINSHMYGKRGKLCQNYIDGRSFFPYCEKFNNSLKKAIRIRDNHICQLCGNVWINGKKYSIHHIHYDKQNCYPDLITLCQSCNSKVNKLSERKNYEALFMNKLNDRQLLFWTKNYLDRE